jgi:deoxyguanosine kinase
MAAQLICVTGPIGVGKTSLAKIISDRMRAEFVSERFEANPYLELLYREGAERWGYRCEVEFLKQRHRQFGEVQALLGEGRTVVADFYPPQMLLFGKLTLQPAQYERYKTLFERVMRHMPRPDQLVLLDAQLPTLLERIRGRGRDMEQTMAPEYLAKLQAGYSEWRERPPAPLLYMDTTEMPIPFCEKAQADALSRIWDALGCCPVNPGSPPAERQPLPAVSKRATTGRTSRRAL